MILYFSGTGNSKYVANRMNEQIRDDVFELSERIRNRDYSELHSDRPWVIVVPTYACRIPRIVEEWLDHVQFCGSKDVYLVMTCGSRIGDAGTHVKKLCARRNWNYKGCTGIVMPVNYIALLKTPTRAEALSIIERAEVFITKAAERISRGAAFPEEQITLLDRASSGVVNQLFYRMFVHSNKFYVTDRCISCEKCVTYCPLANIRLIDGKPVWGEDCTHCMSCIDRCPAEAIEYGRHSRKLPRYICPKV